MDRIYLLMLFYNLLIYNRVIKCLFNRCKLDGRLNFIYNSLIFVKNRGLISMRDYNSGIVLNDSNGRMDMEKGDDEDDDNKNYILVKIPKNSDKLSMNIYWMNNRINMDRSKSESILSTILRMKRTLFKNYMKYNNNIEDTFDNVDNMFDIKFMNNKDIQIGDIDMSCEDVIRLSNYLLINNIRLDIFVNISRLDKVELCNYTMIGCPISLIIKDDTLEYIDNVSIEWLDNNNNIISNDYIYIPHDFMLGMKIKARVKNNLMEYDILESNYTTILEPPINKWQLDRINKFNNINYNINNNPLQINDIRIVSFNILSPTYINSHDSIQRFFPYCPLEYLDSNYRNQLILREILYLKPQILCLQECSSKVYKEYIRPSLSKYYYSYLTLKNSNADEGCATFVERNKFQFLDKYEFNFKDIIKNNQYDHLLGKVSNNWHNLDDYYFDKYHTVYQIGCYKYIDDEKYVFVLNTHLYFHPLGRHIRLLQTYVMLNELEKFKTEMARRYKFDSVKNAFTLIAGDFNAIPNEGVYKLITKGYISINHPDWKYVPFHRKSNPTFLPLGVPPEVTTTVGLADSSSNSLPVNGNVTPGDRDEGCDGSSIMGMMEDGAKDVLDVTSSEIFGYDRTSYFVPDDYGRGVDKEDEFTDENRENYIFVDGYQGYVDSYLNDPIQFTNFVQKFNGTLDYIYYSNNVNVKRVLPGITFDEASEYIGLPSKLYPSDHLSIAADF